MRLVVDLQGAQTANCNSGIGRYSIGLARAMARSAGDHELVLVLNGQFGDAIETIRAEFDGLVPQDRIRVFEVPQLVGPDGWEDPRRVRAAALLREAFLADLRPDVVHVSSLFEGFADPAVTSIAAFAPGLKTAATLYDLQLYLQADLYLRDPRLRDWYFRKLQALKNADLLLAISESSRVAALEHLQIPPERIATISAAVDDRFQPIALSLERTEALLRHHGIAKPFLLHVGVDGLHKAQERLLRAFGLLASSLLEKFQLVLVTDKRTERYEKNMAEAMVQNGLSKDSVVIAGPVSTDDRVALYNSCFASVLPCFDESLGLPALEAMACGAAVIGADTAGLAEMIGRPHALFAPTGTVSLVEKLTQVLDQEDFRQSLRHEGLKQAQKFSWEATARQAWQALEKLAAVQAPGAWPTQNVAKPSLAFVSPMPPLATGIADYSAELLPDLSRHYDITVVVDQPVVQDPWTTANLPVRDVSWFRANALRFDRILYHMGNSPFHRHVMELLNEFPGMVELHDFFLGHFWRGQDISSGQAGSFLRELYRSHGYFASVREAVEGQAAIVDQYPINLSVLHRASGIIVHSPYAMKMAGDWYTVDPSQFRVVSLARAVLPRGDRKEIRLRLGLQPNSFLFCSFGYVATDKGSHDIVEAWLNSAAAADENCHLALVGSISPEDRKHFTAMAGERGLGERLRLTDYCEKNLYRDYLNAADAALQLRRLSRGESSASVLDCLAAGLPTIINAHATLNDFPDDIVLKLPDRFSVEELTQAMDRLWRELEERTVLARKARAYVQEELSPSLISARYHDAIESLARVTPGGRAQRLIKTIAEMDETSPGPNAENSPTLNLPEVARCIDSNRPRIRQRQLLVDVSNIRNVDGRTGIQRVVRGVLWELLTTHREDFRVEPVYVHQNAYYYARLFTFSQISATALPVNDDPVEIAPGDIFLGLDWNPRGTLDQAETLRRWRQRGVEIHFSMYDLLPINSPNFFDAYTFPLVEEWMRLLAEICEGIVCISRTVALELQSWLEAHAPPRRRPCRIGWYHLGSDIEESLPTKGLPENADSLLETLRQHPTFLMVGTVEPRKGHAQALSALELLWERGMKVNLLIVGKHGWLVDALTERIVTHGEINKRLFWFQDASDEFLERLYAVSSALLAASQAEGFGLPLIEAAQHRLPIISRDIPIFREVAGDHAFYFTGFSPGELASALASWLKLFQAGNTPSSVGLKYQTWRESVRQMLAFIDGDQAQTVVGATSPPREKSGKPRPLVPGGDDYGLRLRQKLARIDQRMKPDVVYTPMEPNTFIHFLAEGWSYAEGWAVWTRAPEATMRVPLNLPQGGRHLLELQGLAYLVPERHPAITIRTRVNELAGKTYRVTSDQPEITLEIPLPAETAICLISLTIEHPKSPEEVGMSKDPRKLGFALQKMTLKELGD